jgi:hypothetical protein
VLHTDAAYPFADWNVDDGELVINTNDYDYDMTQYLGKITVSSITQNYTDQFQVLLMDKCRVISLDAPLTLEHANNTQPD